MFGPEIGDVSDLTPTETYHHAVEGIVDLQTRLTDLPLGRISDVIGSKCHPSMSMLSHSHFVNYGGMTEHFCYFYIFVFLWNAYSIFYFILIPYYFLSLSLMRYFWSILLFLLNFLILHQKLFSKINCHSPHLLFFPPFFSALQISQDSLFLLLFSSSTFLYFLCHSLPCPYSSLPFHYFIRLGGYYSYIFARMYAAQIWENVFAKDPLSR